MNVRTRMGERGWTAMLTLLAFGTENQNENDNEIAQRKRRTTLTALAA